MYEHVCSILILQLPQVELILTALKPIYVCVSNPQVAYAVTSIYTSALTLHGNLRCQTATNRGALRNDGH